MKRLLSLLLVASVFACTPTKKEEPGRIADSVMVVSAHPADINGRHKYPAKGR